MPRRQPAAAETTLGFGSAPAWYKAVAGARDAGPKLQRSAGGRCGCLKEIGMRAGREAARLERAPRKGCGGDGTRAVLPCRPGLLRLGHAAYGRGRGLRSGALPGSRRLGPLDERRLAGVRPPGPRAPVARLEDPRVGVQRERRSNSPSRLGLLRTAQNRVQVHPQPTAAVPPQRQVRKPRRKRQVRHDLPRGRGAVRGDPP